MTIYEAASICGKIFDHAGEYPAGVRSRAKKLAKKLSKFAKKITKIYKTGKMTIGGLVMHEDHLVVYTNIGNVNIDVAISDGGRRWQATSPEGYDFELNTSQKEVLKRLIWYRFDNWDRQHPNKTWMCTNIAERLNRICDAIAEMENVEYAPITKIFPTEKPTPAWYYMSDEEIIALDQADGLLD